MFIVRFKFKANNINWIVTLNYTEQSSIGFIMTMGHSFQGRISTMILFELTLIATDKDDVNQIKSISRKQQHC